MMCIVMGEKALAAKGQQTLYFAQPPIYDFEIGFVPRAIDGIRLLQPASDYTPHFNADWQSCLLQP